MARNYSIQQAFEGNFEPYNYSNAMKALEDVRAREQAAITALNQERERVGELSVLEYEKGAENAYRKYQDQMKELDAISDDIAKGNYDYNTIPRALKVKADYNKNLLAVQTAYKNLIDNRNAYVLTKNKMRYDRDPMSVTLDELIENPEAFAQIKNYDREELKNNATDMAKNLMNNIYNMPAHLLDPYNQYLQQIVRHGMMDQEIMKVIEGKNHTRNALDTIIDQLILKSGIQNWDGYFKKDENGNNTATISEQGLKWYNDARQAIAEGLWAASGKDDHDDLKYTEPVINTSRDKSGGGGAQQQVPENKFPIEPIGSVIIHNQQEVEGVKGDIQKSVFGTNKNIEEYKNLNELVPTNIETINTLLPEEVGSIGTNRTVVPILNNQGEFWTNAEIQKTISTIKENIASANTNRRLKLEDGSIMDIWNAKVPLVLLNSKSTPLFGKQNTYIKDLMGTNKELTVNDLLDTIYKLSLEDPYEKDVDKQDAIDILLSTIGSPNFGMHWSVKNRIEDVAEAYKKLGQQEGYLQDKKNEYAYINSGNDATNIQLGMLLDQNKAYESANIFKIPAQYANENDVKNGAASEIISLSRRNTEGKIINFDNNSIEIKVLSDGSTTNPRVLHSDIDEERLEGVKILNTIAEGPKNYSIGFIHGQMVYRLENGKVVLISIPNNKITLAGKDNKKIWDDALSADTWSKALNPEAPRKIPQYKINIDNPKDPKAISFLSKLSNTSESIISLKEAEEFIKDITPSEYYDTSSKINDLGVTDWVSIGTEGDYKMITRTLVINGKPNVVNIIKRNDGITADKDLYMDSGVYVINLTTLAEKHKGDILEYLERDLGIRLAKDQKEYWPTTTKEEARAQEGLTEDLN